MVKNCGNCYNFKFETRYSHTICGGYCIKNKLKLGVFVHLLKNAKNGFIQALKPVSAGNALHLHWVVPLNL